jgi:uncharacterized protein (TIGR01777 family)
MRILITGGTGFVGKAVARALVLDGAELHVLTRNPEKAKASFPYPAKFFAWDALKEEVPKEAWDGVSGVIHLAGDGIADSRWNKARKKSIHDSRVLGTKALVKSLLKHGREIQFFISASAIGLYGIGGDPERTYAETDSAGDDFLAQVTRAWEDASLPLENVPGLRRVLLRIGLVIGPRGGLVEKLTPIFKAYAGGNLGNGKQWMSWIHLSDLVAVTVQATKDSALRGAYNLVAPEPVRNSDFTKTFARALGVLAIAPAPRFGLCLIFGELSNFLLASQRVAPNRLLEHKFRFQYPKLDKALQEILAGLGQDSELYAEQWVPRTVKEVFPFFANEMNLEKITPSFLGFRVIDKSTKKVEQGTHIRYSLSLHGVPIHWESKIDEWVENQRFVDFQLKGPYSKWHHLHEFIPMAGGTLLVDRVRYRLPLGIAGALVAGAWVRSDVRKIFAYRRSVIAKEFGAN